MLLWQPRGRALVGDPERQQGHCCVPITALGTHILAQWPHTFGPAAPELSAGSVLCPMPCSQHVPRDGAPGALGSSVLAVTRVGG